MDREEFREQMTRCNVCGELMDGGCCGPIPLAYVVEREYDTAGGESGPAEATISRDYYCTMCATEDEPEGARAITDKSELHTHPYNIREECYICGCKLD